MAKKVQEPILRNGCGALVEHDSRADELINEAQELGLLPCAFRSSYSMNCHTDWRGDFINKSRNLDIFDVLNNGSAALVRIEEYNDTYQVSFMIVRRVGKQVLATRVDKSRALELVKNQIKLGGAINELAKTAFECKLVKKSGFRIMQKLDDVFCHLSHGKSDRRVYQTIETAKAAKAEQIASATRENKTLYLVKINGFSRVPFRSTFAKYWQNRPALFYGVPASIKIIETITPASTAQELAVN